MYAEVRRVERLSLSMTRVHLGGGTLEDFEESSATDSYINVKFVPAGSPLTPPFDREAVEDLPIHLRPRPRRFTVRRWDGTAGVLAIDAAVHGDVGCAGAWVQRAQPGDRLQFTGPGGDYRPALDADWHLLAGDESALGAIGASLEALPQGAQARVFVVVDGPEHEIELPTTADAAVMWLHRGTAEDPDEMLVRAIASSFLPAGRVDLFVHGEAAEVRAVRRHLLLDRHVDVAQASISPYWRRGLTDEEWRKIKRDWLADQAHDV